MPKKPFYSAALLAAMISPAAAVEPAAPFSGQTTSSSICQPAPDLPSAPVCETGAHAKLNAALEKAFKAALKTNSGAAEILLKRDQAWLVELVQAEDPRRYIGSDDDVASHDATAQSLIEARIKDLEAIATARRSPGLSGRWVNAFGAISIEETAGGAMTASLEAHPVDSSVRDRENCAFKATLTANAASLEGEALVLTPEGEAKVADLPYEEAPRHRLRLFRQGGTLRAIDDGNFECGQFTGNYFRAKSDKDGPQAGSAPEAPFAAPSFDCVKPATATDEEICADPELAEADVRLNRAWKAISDKFTGTSGTALREDQRAFVKALGAVYVYHLHPYWDKQEADRYHFDSARAALMSFMNERIAILEGLEPGRKGWEGTWISNDTMLRIKQTETGTRSVSGTKWEHGDYKSGCDLTMVLDKDGSGRIPKGEDVSADLAAHAGEPNGLKVTRDGQMLRITGSPAFDDGSVCRRNLDAAGAVFPVRENRNLFAKDVMR